MKPFFFFLFLAPFFAAAQDSCQLKTTRDPYTKEVKLTTGFVSIGSNKVSVDAVAKEIDFFFMLEGGKCFDDQSTLIVNFEGNRVKQTYRSSGTMNCEGYFHINFRNTPVTNYGLQKLSSLKIHSLVFKKDKEETTVLLSEDQKEILRKAISCLSAEAKTLFIH